MNANKLFWPGTLTLLGLMLFVQVRSALQETQTWDEGFDLAAGYSYWKTGDFRINREHPPLGKLINALPLLAMGPSLPLDNPAWAQADSPVFGDYFLYRNHIPPDTLLFAGRAMSILTTILAGLAFAIWLRRRRGEAAALTALCFYVFDPNLIAHGRYITSDIFVTVFFFFATVAWAAWLEQPTWRRLVLCGLLLGCAFTSKMSSLYLVAPFAVLYLIRWFQSPRGFGPLHLIRSFATLLGTAAAVIVLVYAPEAGRLIPATQTYRALHPEVMRIHHDIEPGTAVGGILTFAGQRLGVQNHSFLVALNMIAIHNRNGHDAYLMGRVSQKGFREYFPVAFLVKTPVAVLLGLVVALIVAVRRLRHLSILTWTLLLTPLGYFVLSMAGNIDIGIRHILPVYPFLYALIAPVLCSLRSRLWLGILVLLAVESLSIHPHYLAFFNFLSGGPGNGPSWLVDSNIDWGQDIKKLRVWMTANQVEKLHLNYFGRADLAGYGLPFEWLPRTPDLAEWEKVDGFAAASVTPLMGVYTQPGVMDYLRQRTPITKIGYSIYVYDLRKRQLTDLRSSPPLSLHAETHHVQGIDLDGKTLWVSSVNARTKQGFVYSFNLADGRLLRSVEVQNGERFHPGGFMRTGDALWVPVAEYRRQSSALMQKRDSRTLALLSEFEVADHIGAVAVVPEGLVGVNWDARDFYIWSTGGRLIRKTPNPTGLAIQDMKFVDGKLVAGGLRRDKTGAILWLEWPSLRIQRTLEAGKTDRGVAFTHEGLALLGKSLYLLPEDGPSRLFAFELP